MRLIVIIILAIIGVQIWGIFPWWSYLIVTCIIGGVFTPEKSVIKPFWMGFFAGVLVWLGSTLYYDWCYSGTILEKIADSMFGSISVLYIVIALIGGGLTGLSVHAGALMKKGKDILELKIED